MATANRPALRPPTVHCEIGALTPGHADGGWSGAGDIGVDQIGHSCVISPTGEIVAETDSTDSELIVFECDLDMARTCRERFRFAHNRSVQHYTAITNQRDALPPTASDR